MSITNITSVQDIHDRAKGGIAEIAYKLSVHPKTIERWPKCGIPDKYWSVLEKLYGVTPFECFRINAKIKRYSDKILRGAK